MTKDQKLIDKQTRGLLEEFGLDVETDVKDGVAQCMITAMPPTMDWSIGLSAP